MKILYFAQLRERMGKGEEEVAPPASVTTIADLVAWLRARDESSALALAKPEIVKAAIDAKLSQHSAPVAGAQVIALFPPMTGG